jgi:tRNA(Ile)-lysidine synthase
MLERVLKFISRYRSRYNMLAPGARVMVAVSGGADSVALLHVLREIGEQARLSVAGIAHFNHRLRGAASDEDERFVGELAARCGLDFHRGQFDGDLGGNLEQAMRRARREFLTGLLRAGKADCVAVGHTRDDQAETVLFRVLRGSGLSGLAGIHPVTEDGLIRPLIDVQRSEIEEFLRARGIAWREDASNRDRRFARNRIRHELMPQLAREWNPRIVDALAQLADVAWEEEQWWDARVAGELEMSSKSLRALPRAMARRVVRKAIARSKGDLRRIEFSHIEQVLELAGRATAGVVKLPGIEVRKSFDWLRFGQPPPRPGRTLVTIPGVYASPDGTGRVHFELGERPCDRLKVELQLKQVPEPVELRGWLPGDEYRPTGETRGLKLKELFQRSRVPSWKRQAWPIVTGGGKILWAREFGAAADFAANESCQSVLRIWEEPGPFAVTTASEEVHVHRTYVNVEMS